MIRIELLSDGLSFLMNCNSSELQCFSANIFFLFSDTTSENNDENLRIKPRSFVFPEADQEGLNIFCYVDVPLPKVICF